MSTLHAKVRVNLCSFTFADGRRCRTPLCAGHSYLCYDHARKEAKSRAAEETGRDISFFLSGDYLSACDLSLALGRVFAALAQGHIKPKTAATFAYLGQTLLQTIRFAQHEYINAFSTDSWRDVVHAHVKENGQYLNPPPPPAAQPATVATPPRPKPTATPCSGGFTPPPAAQPQAASVPPPPEPASATITPSVRVTAPQTASSGPAISADGHPSKSAVPPGSRSS